MKVKELIEKLSGMPEDAIVFYGSEESHKESDGLPVFTLFDFEPIHYPKLRSCKSCLPTMNSIEENVVVFEYE